VNNVLDIAAKVQMIAKMYDARESLLSILGREEFMRRLADFRPAFEKVRAELKLSDIQTMIALMKTSTDGYQQIGILALSVEIMEPSTPPTTQSDGG
jgi:hypothetical protein